jgi:hypothetical protein
MQQDGQIPWSKSEDWHKRTAITGSALDLEEFQNTELADATH